jgi:hypothetical protein
LRAELDGIPGTNSEKSTITWEFPSNLISSKAKIFGYQLANTIENETESEILKEK